MNVVSIFFGRYKNNFVWLQPFLLGNTLLTFVLIRSKNLVSILLIIEDALNEEYNNEKVING